VSEETETLQVDMAATMFKEGNGAIESASPVQPCMLKVEMVWTPSISIQKGLFHATKSVIGLTTSYATG
jgi:hypothetical protein